MGATYLDCIDTTERLVSALRSAIGATGESSEPPFRRLTMEEAFRRHAGIDLAECRSVADLLRNGERLGLVMPNEPTWEEAFHFIFLSVVEPNLAQDRPLVLIDYPAQIPTTARKKPGTPYAERWELYINGVEIANCYSEETDPEEIRRFLRGEEERKARCRVPHPTDLGFAQLFGVGFPQCAGVALGVDRLRMVFSGARSLGATDGGLSMFAISDILRHQSETR